MARRLLILDNDPVRLGGFDGAMHKFPGDWRMKAWVDTESMLAELDDSLPEAQFISLDAALAPPVVEQLAKRKPNCPVSVHWRHRTSDVAWQSFLRLASTGWDVEMVQYLNESWDKSSWLTTWLGMWQEAVRNLLQFRADTKANHVHAANCERLRTQFEGREAIYWEKYVRRVRVWGIRASVDDRYVQAMAEEILTPGLGAPISAGLPRWWRFGGGYPSRFSRDSWSVGAQHVSWQLFFAPDLVEAVVGLAATLPAEEVFQSERLMKLILTRGGDAARSEQRVFPD